jgi:archaellum component FlaC
MNHEEKMISMLEEINQRLVSVEVAQENILIPQIQALAEGQKTILETLAPKSKVEALEEEVELLKSIIKMHTNQINDLKKAQ